jgi:Chitobiase/beta-hexosaminidase C-terminal domain/Divergent InlB B-repeat domain
MHYHEDVTTFLRMFFMKTNANLRWLASYLLKWGERAPKFVTAVVIATSLLTMALPAHADDDGWGNDKCAAPPVSKIAYPHDSGLIGGLNKYIISGTASSPAYGVLKVKVSLNGGKTWHLATDTSGDHSWSTWEFNWKLSAKKNNGEAEDGENDEADDSKAIKDGRYVIISRAKSKGDSGCAEPIGTGITVTVDTTKPITTASSPDNYVFGSVSQKSPLSVTLSATDGSGSGVAAGYPKYCVDITNTCTPNLTYSSAINFTCAAGSYCTNYVRYRSIDNAGNIETLNSSNVIQNPPDIKPPTTNATAAGYTFGNWTMTSPVLVTLSATDGAGFGIAAGSPKYCIDTTNTCTPNLTANGAISVTCAAGSICTQYVRFNSVDNSGNIETVKGATVEQDLQAPVASISPAGGKIGSSGTVSLSCDDGTGSGCNKIYYTTDGSAPTANSAAYAGPIAISKTTTVNFFSMDKVGNSSAIQSATYTTTYSVTAVPGANGSISCSPTTVDYNASSDCSITPAAGYHLANVSVGPTGGALSPFVAVTKYTIANIKADMTISAAFAIDTFTVTPTSGPGGSISPDTAQTVDINGTTKFTVTPNTGYHIDSVTGCNGTLSGNVFTTGAITTNCTVAATFANDTFTITTNAGPDGSIVCTSTIVPYNADVNCTITPNGGYHATVSGSCGATLTANNSYAIKAVKADCTIDATFANSAPSMPTISSPTTREVATVTPTLAVNASIDPDGDKVMYTFEIYSDSGLSKLVAASTNTENTSWTAPALADNTLYYWRAQASDGFLNSNWMPTANFFVNTVNDNPSKPGISSPADNMLVATLTPVLSVTNATDVDIYDTITYDFDIASDAGFNTIVASAPGVAQGAGGTTSWSLPQAQSLSEDTTYFWRVRAKDNNGGMSDWASASFFVNTVNHPPTAPLVKSPTDGSEVATFTPSLVVNNATDPDRQSLMYTFELDTVNTFDSTTDHQISGLVAEGSGTTSWTPTTLREDTTYYWRVKASDGQLDGPFTASAKFFVNTVNEAPSVPTLNNPANGTWVTVLAPTLQVNASTDPDMDSLTYEFQVSTDSTFSTLVTSADKAGTSWVVPMNLANNTQYWWRAQARDEHDLASGWMEPASFYASDKGYNAPPNITIYSPAVAEKTNAASYTITWSASDPDSNPVITLFYDKIGSGFSGTQIATGTTIHLSDSVSSYNWDISGLSDGTYYVYAIIDDGFTVNKAYAKGSLTINRTPPTPVITASAGANGSISPSGPVSVQNGATQDFIITPSPGYRADQLTVDGVSKTISTTQSYPMTYRFTNVIGDHTISVSFMKDEFTISATATVGGSISPLGDTSVARGKDSQVYTFPAITGYALAYVTIDGSQNIGPAPSYTFTNVNINHTIKAYFTLTTNVITTSVDSDSTWGTISPSNPAVKYGYDQKFTMTPTVGYHVANVVVDGTSVGAVTSFTFNSVTAPHTIAATFAENTRYTITATATMNGSSTTNGSISPAGQVSALGGTNQTFNIAPASAYRIKDVLVDGTSAGRVTSYTFPNIQKAHTIEAVFTDNVYTITTTAGANGSITPTQTVQPGANWTVNITPNDGYEVQNVLVDNASQGATTAYAFSNVMADHTITASFRVKTWPITVTAGANGSITPGNLSVTNNASQTFTITPALGYAIADVVVDGTSVNKVTSYTFNSVTAPHSISASFVQTPSLTITATAGPNGSISPSGDVSVLSGANQTFTFTPDTTPVLYRVSTVTVDGAPQPLGLNYTFRNVTANHKIEVTFTPDNYTIKAFAKLGASFTTQGGTISPAGNTDVPKGTNQTYTITPAPGYAVLYVIVDASNLGPISSYTFTNVNIGHTITAYFTVASNKITASVDPNANGSISPYGVTPVQDKGSQTYTIMPAAGYHVADVLVDLVSVGAVTSYPFTNVMADHTISATFAPNPSYDILTNVVGTGSISPTGVILTGPNSGQNGVSVLGGTAKTFNITPDTGSLIDYVKVDGVSVSPAPTSYTFTDINAGHTIEAGFKTDQTYNQPPPSTETFTITASISGACGGTITPWGVNGVNSVSGGSNVTYTVSPGADCTTVDVKIDGVSKGGDTYFYFTNAKADHTIEAIFDWMP